MAVLIYGPPQIVTFALYREKDFVQVPFVAWPGMPAAQPIGIGLAKFPAPIPHGFLCQQDTAFSHELFDIPIAQAEAKVEPDAVADNLCREPMALI
jgi:hypothetical protein